MNLRLAPIFVALMLSAGFGVAQTLPTQARFVMSHFKIVGVDQDERLFLSWSSDGVTWTALNDGNPVWQPPGWAGFWNVVRDPTIAFANGFYWVAYTAGNYGKGSSFGLVKSADLLNWTQVGPISVPIPNATDPLTWNPVFFEEGGGSLHVMISISPINGSTYHPVPGMRIYETHPLNADMTQWSAPVPVELPDANTNECFVWKEGARYHCVYVDFGRSAAIVHATSDHLITGWRRQQVLGLGGQEGPFVMPRPNGGYRLYVESGHSGLPFGYRAIDFDASFSNPSPAVALSSTVTMRNGKACSARNTLSFGAWQSQTLSSVPLEKREPLADADDDGLSNLIEHALVTDPVQSTPVAARPAPGLLSIGGVSFPGFRYAYRRQSLDVTTAAEFSSGGFGNTWSTNGVETLSRTLLSDGTTRIETRASAAPNAFFRLKATLESPTPASTSPSFSTTRSARTLSKTKPSRK
jgi:hypothetical protein